MDSPASDDAQSAEHLTSSEPSRASSFTAQATSEVPSVASPIPGDANAPAAILTVASQISGDANVPSDASWMPGDASVPSGTFRVPGDAIAPSAVPQQADVVHQQQQQHLQPSAACLLPVSEQHKSEAGEALLHSATMESPTDSAAPLTDPICGDSPARGEYDPERYKPYTQPAEAAQAQALSEAHQWSARDHDAAHAQALSPQNHATQTQSETDSQTQTQLVGQSPKQAALLRLRSLTVKQSQAIKASSADTQGALRLLSERQIGQQAEGQRAEGDLQLLAERHASHEVEGKVSTKTAVGKSIRAMPGVLSPRRSSSVAKLRSQSLAKHLQEPRYVSLRRLPLVPISGTGTDGSQQLNNGLAGPPATPREAEDARKAARPDSPNAQSGAEQLGESLQQLMAESAGCHMTPQQAEDARKASSTLSVNTQSVAAAQLAADRAQAEQLCPVHDAGTLNLTDIDVVIDTECDARSSDLPSIATHSAATLNLRLCSPRVCSRSGTGENTSELTPQQNRSSSKSEGASPIRLSSNSDSSPVLDHDPHQHSVSPASCHHADESGVQESTVRHSGNSSCTVSVCIRSSGTGAAISLEVQDVCAQDSAAEKAAGMTHPVVSKAASPEEDAMTMLGLFPAASQGPDDALPSSPLQVSQAAAAESYLRGEEDSTENQLTRLTEDRVDSAESPEVTHDREREPRAVPSSLGEDDHRAASSSPGKRGSLGQGFMGRLEGGLRNWLGRGSKQSVGQCLISVKCQGLHYTMHLCSMTAGVDYTYIYGC